LISFCHPPQTKSLCVIQDADTTSTNVSASRLKIRQFGTADWKRDHGNVASTFDEYLRGIQVTYRVITKPQSMSGAGFKIHTCDENTKLNYQNQNTSLGERLRFRNSTKLIDHIF
jgi:hypothetical protein